MKSLDGASPEKPDPIFEAATAKLKKFRHIMSKTIDKKFSINTHDFKFYITPVVEKYLIGQSFHHVYVSQINNRGFNFYINIYNSVHHADITFTIQNDYLKTNLRNILAFFETFYKDVSIVYMANCKTSRSMNNIFSSWFLPDLEVYQSNFKFFGRNPIYKSALPWDVSQKIEMLDFLEGDELHFVQQFIDLYREHVIPKDILFNFDFTAPPDDMRNYLDMIKMIKF